MAYRGQALAFRGSDTVLKVGMDLKISPELDH